MVISKSEWESIMNYVKDQLLKQLVPAVYGNGYGSDVVPKATIISIPALITQEQFIADTGTKRERKKVVIETDNGFDKWWSLYPLNSNFNYKSMKFNGGVKTFRVDKEKCYRKYTQILNEEGITTEQMVKALQIQIHNVKEESYQSGENSMRYFGMSTSYLNQGKYAGFIGQEEETEEYNESNNCA